MQRSTQTKSSNSDTTGTRCPLCGANLIYDAHTRDCPVFGVSMKPDLEGYNGYDKGDYDYD